jgi:very-short-patch-repair endonuclease
VSGCPISVGHASIDERIAAIAGAQQGRVSRAQLLAAAITPSAVDRRHRNGQLIRVHPGVYAVAHTAPIPLADETTALLACGDGALLSHHSAITRWRMRPGIARPIHVTIRAGRQGPAPDGVLVHRSTTLAAADARIHEGLPVTSPARTLLDVASTLTDRDIERLLDEAMFALRLVTRAQIADVLRRAGRHPGAATLARVYRGHTRSTRTESEPEEQLLELIRAAGIPEPELQAYVLGHRIDYLWRAQGVAVEVDGYDFHSSPAAFERDRRRDGQLLTRAGIVVIRLTRRRIAEEPFAVVAELVRAVGE